jgi:signal transduction histidine kinase
LKVTQHAGKYTVKYAGKGATLRVHVGQDGKRLCTELIDDRAGFETNATPSRHGRVNMKGRLATIGAELVLEYKPAVETTVRTANSVQPIGSAARAGPS